MNFFINKLLVFFLLNTLLRRDNVLFVQVHMCLIFNYYLIFFLLYALPRENVYEKQLLSL